MLSEFLLLSLCFSVGEGKEKERRRERSLEMVCLQCLSFFCDVVKWQNKSIHALDYMKLYS